MADPADVGIVLIGRNEGERLRASLASVLPLSMRVVYVDSGSRDGSVTLASSMGCAVVELTTDRLFSAARARNAGLARLLALYPTLDYVQFIDGDCLLDPDWLRHALAQMTADPTLAVVCGRRRERYPERSIYNQMIDMEWDTPVGRADACGGDALMRVAALQAVGGFDEAFAAGEEPELCYRLRLRGWGVWRLAAEMTQHDAAMTQFGQWWQRNVRSGSAYAQGAWTHGHGPQRYNVRASASIWLWAALVPAFGLLATRLTRGVALLVLLPLYGRLFGRIVGYRVTQHHDLPAAARRYALFVILGKFAQLVGQIRFLLRRESRLIEYKSAPAEQPVA